MSDFLSNLINLANKSKLKNGIRHSVVREQALARRYDLVYYFNTHHNNHNLVPHTHGVDKPIPAPLVASTPVDSEGNRFMSITAMNSYSQKSFEEIRYETPKYQLGVDNSPSNVNPSPTEATPGETTEKSDKPATEPAVPEEVKIPPHNIFVNAAFPWPSDLLSLRPKDMTPPSPSVPGSLVIEKAVSGVAPSQPQVGVVVTLESDKYRFFLL